MLQRQARTPHIISDKLFKMGVANFALIAVISLVGFVISDDQRVPWAQITPAPSVPPQHLHQRGYDTSNPYLYGYTSVGMNGTRTIWSAKSCNKIAPTMFVETIQDTVFGGCWAVGTTTILELWAVTASADFITACSGHMAIGTSTTWDCSTLGNCIFDTIYPDLASTSPTLGATCAQATAGKTYFHTLVTPTAASTETSHGLSKGDIIALAVGLGVGIPTIIIMICAWLCPCTPILKFHRRRHQTM